MGLLKLNDENFEHRHIGDVKRIQFILENNGYTFSLAVCAWIWEEYSDRYAAGWLSLDSDDEEVFKTLKICTDLI